MCRKQIKSIFLTVKYTYAVYIFFSLGTSQIIKRWLTELHMSSNI